MPGDFQAERSADGTSAATHEFSDVSFDKPQMTALQRNHDEGTTV